MSKLNQFLNREPEDGEEIVDGNFGCGSCEEDIPFARFNPSTGRYYWICSSNHVTEINLV